MFAKFALILLFALSQTSAELPTLYEYYTAGGIKSGLVAEGDTFHLNGKPFMIFSGSFHPFRVHQNKWKEQLMKFKAAGLNTIQFLTPWNQHEEIPGHFDFETGMLNLTNFLDIVKEVELFVLFRPGPYICGEYEFGGFPAWLLRDQNLKLRTGYKPYLDAIDKYWSRLLTVVKDHQFSTNGGPIIAVQLENEYASYGNTGHIDDGNYMRALKEMALKYGVKELLYTCDNWVTKQGTLPGIYQSANFGSDAVNKLKAWKSLNPNWPLYVSEYWTGWFDGWGQPHHRTPIDTYVKELEAIVMQMNSSVNFYMFLGGTNFGWNSGHGIITSYDYDAPLSEAGNYTEKYFKTKEIIEKYTKERHLPEIRKPDPPKVENPANYGVVKMTEQLSMNDFIKHLKAYNVDKPINPELLDVGPGYGQNVGFTLYRTTIPKSTSLTFTSGDIRDRAFLVIDNNEQIQPYLYPSNKPISLNFDPKKFTKSGDEHTLDILVENMGRDNFGKAMDSMRKGLSQDIEIDNKVHKNWQMFAIDFKQDFIDKIRTDKWSPGVAYNSPALFRGYFEITDKPRDTFIRLDGWHTSNVFINGFNIGRYWNNGPQKALYVPSPLLKTGVNEVILFETYGAGTQVEFIDKPDLG